MQATFRGRVCQCPVVQGVKFWVKVKTNAQMYVIITVMIFFHMYKQWRILETYSNGKNIFGLLCNMAYLKTN